MPFDSAPASPQNIAIVGGGIAGMAAAWLLSRHHRITLFESSARLGGHARTILAGKNGSQPVDTGFIVFNHVTYPHLSRLFLDLDVPTEKSDMSFAVSAENGRVEYALNSIGSLFGQRRNLARPAFWDMLRDIARFNDRAATAADDPALSIDQLIDRLRLGRWFRDYYLRPFCGAIWSTDAEEIGRFPAQALVRFLGNHALLSATGQHQWWTVSGGSRSYVSRLETALLTRNVDIRTSSPVKHIRRMPNGVELRCTSDLPRHFDQVILACHADRALSMLEEPDPPLRAALGGIRFQDNRAVLHRDPALMPRRRKCWASWVYRSGDKAEGVGVTYWMNRLQNIPMSDPLFVTLNPSRNIEYGSIYDETVFRHPVFDHDALAAQSEIARLQGENGIWFAGAWLRNGFHEDGFASALRIARLLTPIPA